MVAPTPISLGPRVGAFLAYEQPAYMSRKEALINSGQGKVKSGTLLVVSGGGYIKAAAGSTPTAILYNDVDATSAAAPCVVIYRDAVVNSHELSYGADVDTDGEKAALATALGAVNIQVRS